MNVKHWLIGIAAVLAASFATIPTQAAPLSAPSTDIKAGQTSSVDRVAYRRCWWRHGHRHCRWYGRYYRPYDYYPFASDPYYYGPSIGFYFGGGGHRHRFHGHHHHR
jgi:hypothetical protein